MKRSKTALIFIFQPKLIVFGLAFYNFTLLWLASRKFGENTCLACPWYSDWNYFNEPSVLLSCATLLLISKWWSYIISSFLSGFVIIKGAYLITNFGLPQWLQYLSKQWELRQELEIDIFKEWEVQLLLAVVIFSFTVFYLVRESTRKIVLQ